MFSKFSANIIVMFHRTPADKKLAEEFVSSNCMKCHVGMSTLFVSEAETFSSQSLEHEIFQSIDNIFEVISHECMLKQIFDSCFSCRLLFIKVLNW